MALTISESTLSANEGTGTTLSITANIPGTATCVWIGWTFDDQGTTDRTYTVTVEGSATNVAQVQQKTESLSNHAFAVHRNFPPSTGAAVAIAVSASAAFASRAWRIIVLYAEGGNTTTAEENVQLTESATSTSLATSTTSAVGDMVVSFGTADGRSVASTAPNPSPTAAFSEWNTSGGIYLSASRTDGTGGSVSTGWAWGGSSVNAAEITFSAKVAAAAGTTPKGPLTNPVAGPFGGPIG
jgi:hypothetical protein